MIKDRGTIKWTALMLPEHVQQIRKLWEDGEKVPERTVDEQQIETINLILTRAITNHISVKIIYYENGTYLNQIGHISKINPYNCVLCLSTLQGEKININTNRILEVELAV
ncbi:YolD-like family protein [Schinkia sp. CFF1]